MQYTIKNEWLGSGHTPYPYLQIIFVPNDPILGSTIKGVDIIDYPKIIAALAKSESFPLSQIIWLKSYADLDEEDISTGYGFNSDEIGVICQLEPTITIYKISFIDKLFFDYGSKLLEAYQENKSIPKEWIDDMHTNLEKLNQKILSCYLS